MKNNREPNAILIIGPAWIGDMVMAQTLFKFLLANYPTVAIDVLAPQWTFPLLERMSQVRSSIFFPLGHGQLRIRERYAFAKKLRQRGYDQAIVLPCSFKSALTALWAKIPLRTGWFGEWRVGLLNDMRFLNRKEFPLMIEQFCALGLPAGNRLPAQLEQFYPSLLVDKNKQQAVLNKLELNTDNPIIALCPGAEYGPAKRWPSSYFAQIAKKIEAKGWQVWVFGSPKDSDQAKDIVAAGKNIIDLTGKTTLLEAIDLMSLAQAVISNDSGLMHIAAALNRPLIVIYGSSSPAFTPPLTKHVEIINLELDCSPCFKRTCPLGHLNCMKQVYPDVVFSKLLALIEYDQNLGERYGSHS